MRQTLFHIPHELLGIPVMGFGWMLGLWAVAAIAFFVWLGRRQGWTAETRSYLPVVGVMGMVLVFAAWMEETDIDGAILGVPIRGYGTFMLLAVLAGVGAWMHATHTAYAFVVSAVVGAVLAVLMVLYRRAWSKHSNQFWMIINEIMTIRDPNELSEIAAERKSSMLLLPYGIPIAIGAISYFAYTGMLTNI